MEPVSREIDPKRHDDVVGSLFLYDLFDAREGTLYQLTNVQVL